MQPIVNGLQDQYATQVAFISFNAQDGADGELFFGDLGLPGHPSFVIYSASGQQVYRGVGIISADELQRQIEAALATE